MASKIRIAIVLLFAVFTIDARISLAFTSNPTTSGQTAAIAANPNLSPVGQAILNMLTDMTNRPSNRVISGQFGAYGQGQTAALASQVLQKIYDASGKWPALTGMDYHTWDLYHLHNYSEPNQFLIDYWNKGGLVTVSWHAPNPWTGGEAGDRTGGPNGTAPNVRDLVTSGTVANGKWMALLDDVASGLQQLRDAGVVVIWRPFHEMNGGWSWWDEQAQADYIALWQHMFNYFTNTKGLNNLLWAYSPNTNNNQWNARSSYFYPGSAYVDIVGLDEYMNRGEDPLHINDWHEYDDLAALNKPMALLEFGPTPASGSGWQDPPYDASRLIRDIRAMYPKIVLFQFWEYIWGLDRQTNISALMNDPWVMTRDTVDWKSAINTPTATYTVTPIQPTATQSSPNSTLKVKYMVGNGNAANPQVAAHLTVINSGTTDVPLSQLKLRYWFTQDAAPSLTFQCTYAQAGCPNVTGTFGVVSPIATYADSYVEVGFTNEAGTLQGYDAFSDVGLLISRSDTLNFTQSNDYSFDATKTTATDWMNVTLYYNGVLVWGTPPATDPGIVNTPTATSIPPRATTLTPAIKVRYKTTATAASVKEIQPNLQVVNVTNSSIPLTEVKVRYYFTMDNGRTPTYRCNQAQIGCSKIVGKFVTMPAPVNGANIYLELSFTGGSLAALGQTGEIQVRIRNADGSAVNQSNDYSFDATKTTATDWQKTTGYRNSQLVWGIEPPSGPATMIAPMVTATTQSNVAPTFVPVTK